MPYEMHRIFCAPAGDLEEERRAFYKAVSAFNEHHAMPRNVLFVSVALPDNVSDKTAFQGPINENIRACRYYVQLIEDSWGPPNKNYEKDCAIARRAVTDPALPMQEVIVWFKKPLLPHKVDPEVAALKESMRSEQGGVTEFETAEEFKDKLSAQLAVWLETVAPASRSTSA